MLTNSLEQVSVGVTLTLFLRVRNNPKDWRARVGRFTGLRLVDMLTCAICPELIIYEMHTLYDKHHKVASLINKFTKTQTSSYVKNLIKVI